MRPRLGGLLLVFVSSPTHERAGFGLLLLDMERTRGLDMALATWRAAAAGSDGDAAARAAKSARERDREWQRYCVRDTPWAACLETARHGERQPGERETEQSRAEHDSKREGLALG